MTGLARTALDIGREHGFQAGVVACDGVLRRGVTRRDLETQLTGMRNWPGITRCARRGRRTPIRAPSPSGESLARILVEELGVGRAETQFPVRLPAGTVVVRPADRLSRVRVRRAGEVPRAEDGGVADRPVDEVVWEEKKRERLDLCRGPRVSRIIWEDLWGAARERAKVRLRAEYAVTATRFGAGAPAAPGGVLAPDARPCACRLTARDRAL